MRIISWNLNGITAADTAAPIRTAMLDYNPSLLVLHEFGYSAEALTLLDLLSNAGWHAYANTVRGKFFRTFAFAPAGVDLIAPPVEISGFVPYWVELRFGRLGISGAHIPLEKKSSSASRAAHWNAALAVARNIGNRPHILIGDLNTTLHAVDEAFGSVPGEKYLRELENLGWVEAWRRLHEHAPAAEKYSWYHWDSGNGFRLDQAWLSPALLPRLQDAIMDHRVRERGLSDHSMLIVDLDIN